MVQEPLGPVLNAAVLGRPVAHSLSPLLHTAGYRALGLDDWAYGAHDVGADELAAWVQERDDSWRGLSLTMPLKEAALAVAATVSETARVTGSVNTLVRRPDLGVGRPQHRRARLGRRPRHVDHAGAATVLGSGATARSAAVGARPARGHAGPHRRAQPATTTEIVALLDSLGVRGRPRRPRGLGARTRPARAVDAAPGRRRRRIGTTPCRRRPAGRDPARRRLRRVAHAAGASRRSVRVPTWCPGSTCSCTRRPSSSGCSPAGAPVEAMLAAGRAALGR